MGVLQGVYAKRQADLARRKAGVTTIVTEELSRCLGGGGKYLSFLEPVQEEGFTIQQDMEKVENMLNADVFFINSGACSHRSALHVFYGSF